MRKLPILIVGMCVVASAVATAPTPAAAAQSVTEYVTIEGEVVRYEPGRTIVVREASGKEVVYTLAPKITVPKDVQVGQRVTLYAEPTAEGGSQIVRRVTTTSVTPEGDVKQTTEDTRTLPGGMTSKTTTTQITGKVAAYEAGKTVTVVRSDGTKVTYLITGQSTIPPDLVVGKSITLMPMTDANGNVVRTITYVVPPPGN